MNVALCSITNANYVAAAELQVMTQQQPFVPTNALALAEIAFDNRLIPLGVVDEATHTMVGLLIYQFAEETGGWWLHHLMIAEVYQRQGYGKKAVALLIQQLPASSRPSRLDTRYAVGNESAREFSTALGFQPTSQPLNGFVRVSLALPAALIPPPAITLRDTTLQNARATIQLAVAPGQQRFVATNAESLIQSKFEPHWLTKGVYQENQLVGFVMYGHDPVFGWGILRLMIDAAYQQRGYGRIAMEQVLAHIRAEGGTSVGLSYERDNYVAQRLYHSMGFIETGEEPFGEPFAVLKLA